MTVRDLVFLTGEHPGAFVAFFVGVPLTAWFLGRVAGPLKSGETPWKHFFCLLVYSACIPGMLSAMVTAYSIFFTRENLLDVDLLVYGLPIVSMIVTLALIGRTVKFENIPGFDRLSGLMILLAATFGVVLAVEKTRLWIIFGGSIYTLILLGGALFVLMKWAAHSVFRRRDQPQMKRPEFKFPK
jgi:hypothetical protein